jgi:serine protease AprX
VVAAGNDGRDDSAGNNGYGTINAPGNDPYVITVGALNLIESTNKRTTHAPAVGSVPFMPQGSAAARSAKR